MKASIQAKVAMKGNEFLPEPGLIILFGSGETSSTGRRIFETVFKSLPHSPRLALLETPAGFELNSHQVINRVRDFFIHQLQNYNPRVDIIPARKQGTRFSPDNPEIVTPLLYADLIFMGPGSPSYAIRQLSNSLAWNYLIACSRLGTVIALASAAAIAISACALPVYEIYKVGEDLHWIPGLDFFKHYGLKLVFIPHWNNHDGGVDLDTSRCFMGQERFGHLIEMLPEEMTIIGLDEKTALIMDLSNCECQVRGLGMVTVLHKGLEDIHKRQLNTDLLLSKSITGIDNEAVKSAAQRDYHGHQYKDGQFFPMSELGPFQSYQAGSNLPTSIWQQAVQVKQYIENESIQPIPEEVSLLLQARQKARLAGDWDCADELRQQVHKLGWEILDTKNGPVSRKLP